MKEISSCRWSKMLLVIVIGLVLIPISVVSVDTDMGMSTGTDTGTTLKKGINIETAGTQGTDMGRGTDTNLHPVSVVPLDQLLKKFGASLVENNPELKSASDIEKAKAGFKEYLKLLSNAGEGVSNDVWGRINDIFHDERTSFTCSSHTQNLRDLFEAMGIDPRSLGQISGEMSTINPLNVNSDHGALVLIGKDGKRYVFDAWAHATDRDSWSPFDDLYGEGDRSSFNGMDIDSWNKMMRDGGYTSFIYQPSEGVESEAVPTAGMAVDSIVSPGHITSNNINANLPANPIESTTDEGSANIKGNLTCGDWVAPKSKGCWQETYDLNGFRGSPVQTGYWIYYYPNGLKSSEGVYEDGFKVGHWIGYYSDGRKAGETNYTREMRQG